MANATTTADAALPRPAVPQKALKWIETTEQSTPAKQFSYEEHYQQAKARSRMGKVLKNPLVFLGMLATVGALTLGIRANLRGDRFRQQMMMRYRVGFQAFTVVMLAGGLAAAQLLTKDDDDD